MGKSIQETMKVETTQEFEKISYFWKVRFGNQEQYRFKNKQVDPVV